jgi:hypothetical protein
VSGRYPGEQWPGEQWPGEQGPGEQGYGYGEQGYPRQDYGQAGDPRPGDPRGDGRSRRDGGVWGADAPLPPEASRDAAWGERSLPPHDSFPQRGAPQGGGSRPNRALPPDSAYQSGPWRGAQPAQPGREQQRGGRQDSRDQWDRDPFSSGGQQSQPGRDQRRFSSGPQQVQPDSAPRGPAQRGTPQYGLPEYGSSRPGPAQHSSPRHTSARHSGPNPQHDGRRAAHRDTGGYQMANDYPDGELVPGFGVPASDRDYGRDPDRDDWRDNRREDPRRGPGRDRYADERYADERYGDDRYGDGRSAPAAGPATASTRATGTTPDAGQAATSERVMTMMRTASHDGGAAGSGGSPRGSRSWSS